MGSSAEPGGSKARRMVQSPSRQEEASSGGDFLAAGCNFQSQLLATSRPVDTVGAPMNSGASLVARTQTSAD